MKSTQKELTLLQKAQDTLRQLSTEKLQVAIDFLAYLQDKKAQEATDELLSIPNFEDELREAEAGEVVSFQSIRQSFLEKSIECFL